MVGDTLANSLDLFVDLVTTFGAFEFFGKAAQLLPELFKRAPVVAAGLHLAEVAHDLFSK